MVYAAVGLMPHYLITRQADNGANIVYVHVDEYDRFDVISWLTKNYGAAGRSDAWWNTTTGVYMREDIYTHWSLVS
jgi:hypothetical protein